jgi:hypothetical protein
MKSSLNMASSIHNKKKSFVSKIDDTANETIEYNFI